MSKFDMLTALDESGLDDIVLKILDYFNPKELLPVFQVSKGWRDWDDKTIWRRKLKQLRTEDSWLRAHQDNFDKKTDKEKCLLIQRLRQNWSLAKADVKKCDVGSTVLSLCMLDSTCLVGLNNGYLQEWTLDGHLVRENDMHLKGIKTVVRGGNQTLITGSYDGCCSIWTQQDWRLVRRICIGVSITEVVYVKSGCENGNEGKGCLYICGDEGHISEYDILLSGDTPLQEAMFSSDNRGGTPFANWKIEGGDMVNSLSIFNKLNVLVSGNDGGELCVRGLQDGGVQTHLEGHQSGCGITALVQDDVYLWSSSFDTTVRLWDSKDWSCLAVLTGHTQPVRSLQIVSNCVISGDYRGFVMIWDKNIINAEVTKYKEKESVNNSATKQNSIYKIRHGRLVQPRQGVAEVLQHTAFLEHSGHVTCIQANSGHLVSGSRDKSIVIHSFCRDLSRKKKIKARQSYFDNFSIY